jgi:hypothetical protein
VDFWILNTQYPMKDIANSEKCRQNNIMQKRKREQKKEHKNNKD